MGCVTQIGEQALNVGRVAVARRGLAGDGRRDDGRPPVRLVHAGGLQRGRGDPGRSPRHRRRGGRRVDVARADGVEPRRGGVGGPQPEDRRALADRPAGHLRRGDREGVGALARRSRRVLARVEPPRGRRDRRRPFEREIVPVDLGNGETFSVDEAPRRDTSAEKLAGLNPAFTEDGRVTAGNSSQIVDGAAAMLARQRGRGLAPRADAARPLRLLRDRGRRPLPDAARQPSGVRSRPSSRQARLGRHGRDRDQRGIRLRRPADARRHGPARALGGGRREPERRRHLARPSARRDGRADHRDAARRARPPRARATGWPACASARARRSRP